MQVGGGVGAPARPSPTADDGRTRHRVTALLLDGRLGSGRRVTVGVRDGALDFAVDQPAGAAPAGV